MADLHPIPPMPTKAAHCRPGPWGFAVERIAIGKLRIRKSYQRQITRRSMRMAQKIADDFSWAKFGVLIVRAVEGEDVFEVIDGQHRAMAAKMLAADWVPAVVIDDGAAEAFLGINRDRTNLTPVAIFRAELAAGDAEAVEIAGIAEAVGVEIIAQARKGGPRRGETLAISTMRSIYRAKGSSGLRTAILVLVKAEGFAEIGPDAPSWITADRLRVAAELFKLLWRDWEGGEDDLAEEMGQALSAVDWERIKDEAQLQHMDNGQSKWRCLFGLLLREITQWRARQ